mmetsp:Transcript_56529/g.183739  ORF Transcript_56529/g.183739 Transcript_56529/m.183739 type:complete len:230 (+) Transcript_56529:813-1502(+)
MFLHPVVQKGHPLFACLGLSFCCMGGCSFRFRPVGSDLYPTPGPSVDFWLRASLCHVCLGCVVCFDFCSVSRHPSAVDGGSDFSFCCGSSFYQGFGAAAGFCSSFLLHRLAQASSHRHSCFDFCAVDFCFAHVPCDQHRVLSSSHRAACPPPSCALVPFPSPALVAASLPPPSLAWPVQQPPQPISRPPPPLSAAPSLLPPFAPAPPSTSVPPPIFAFPSPLFLLPVLS